MRIFFFFFGGGGSFSKQEIGLYGSSFRVQRVVVQTLRLDAHLFGVLLEEAQTEPLVQLHFALVPDALQLAVVREHLQSR